MLRRGRAAVKRRSARELAFVKGQIVDGDALGIVVEQQDAGDISQSGAAGEAIPLFAQIREPQTGDFGAVATQKDYREGAMFATAQIEGECGLIVIKLDCDGTFADAVSGDNAAPETRSKSPSASIC